VAHIGETLRGNTEGRKSCRGNAFRTTCARDAATFSAKRIDSWLSAWRRILDAYHIGFLLPCKSRFASARLRGLEIQVACRICAHATRESGSCYYFRTVTHPEFSEYREFFYSDGRKIVPMDLLHKQFTEFSLAVWLMDDGAVDRRQLRLNTQSFSFSENEALSSLLRAKFGIEARLNRDKDRYRLRINDASISRLKHLVGPILIPSMLYKLPL
jgi:hypothetical protein